MSKGSVLNSIPDLQLEWATDYPTLSIRDFLMGRKGFTERRYRHIISNAPACNWRLRREEIQNQITFKKLERHVEEAADMHRNYFSASKLTLARSIEFLNSGKPSRSTDILNCAKAIETSQKIFLSSMGIADGQGIVQIHQQQVVNMTKEPSQITVSPDVERQLTYDDIMALIELKREQKRIAAAQLQDVERVDV